MNYLDYGSKLRLSRAWALAILISYLYFVMPFYQIFFHRPRYSIHNHPLQISRAVTYSIIIHHLENWLF
jgi:hypothetical protein